MDKVKKRKEERKAGKQALQLAAQEKKMAQEKQYFQECLATARRGGMVQPKAAERDLFAQQGCQGINFDQYQHIPVEVKLPPGESRWSGPIAQFDELALPEFLNRNLSLMRYQKPTPIQCYSLAIAAAGYDLMCCAQTGSGKTAAFLVPACTRLVSHRPSSSRSAKASASPRCVIMAPTRELASQIELEAQKLANRSPLRSVAVYGGADQRKQVKDLAMGVDIVVATPGRLTDFCDRGIVSLSSTELLVLDEADRMLDMGFEPQIRRIVLEGDMPAKENRLTFLFSATFPLQIQQLAQQFLREYVWVGVGRVGSTTESIKQRLVLATNEKRNKLNLVARAIRQGPGNGTGRTLVFVQKKRTASWLKKMLAKGGVEGAPPAERFDPITACDIHGDRSQAQREAALSSFRAGSCKVLVATDVAARGLDIADVQHVIIMDLPTGPEDFDSYVHRIGRTGRAGHFGLATSLYVPGTDRQGNANIAPLLLGMLMESNQQIPDWFLALPECPQSTQQTAAQGEATSAGAQSSLRKQQPKLAEPKRRRSSGAAGESSVPIENGPRAMSAPGAAKSRKRNNKNKPNAGGYPRPQGAAAEVESLQSQAAATARKVPNWPKGKKRQSGNEPDVTWEELCADEDARRAEQADADRMRTAQVPPRRKKKNGGQKADALGARTTLLVPKPSHPTSPKGPGVALPKPKAAANNWTNPRGHAQCALPKPKAK